MIRKINLDAFTQKIAGNYTPGDILLVLCDASLGPLSVNLPDVKSLKDGFLMLKKIDSTANAITFSSIPGQLIDGSTSMTLESQYESEILISDMSNYFRFANSAFI